MSQKFSMEPRVSFLTELLKEIDDCTLQIPRFQREFVWAWEQQRDLLCSIYEGLPIGAILVWSTRLTNIKSYSSIGPFKLNNPMQDSYYKMYIMDGLQRMTTLYTTLLHPINDGYQSLSGTEDFLVYCDLESEKIEDLFVKKSEIQLDGNKIPKNYMPLRIVFDTKAVLKFQRSISEDNESWIDKSDEVVSTFKNYKIPIIPLESDKQELVTKSFERINTRGTTMSETHMLNALSYSDDFDLIEKLNEYRDEYLNDIVEWEYIDADFILAIIKMELGYDIYFKDTDKLAKELNEILLKKVFRAIRSFIDFSIKTMGLNSKALYPYKLQMYGLTYAFLQKQPPCKEALEAWFIITTYTGAFGTTARNSSNALNDLITYIETKKFTWTLKVPPQINVWRDNTSFRTARVKAWMQTLAKKQDIILNPLISSTKRIADHKGKLIKKPIELKGFTNKRAGSYFLVEPGKVKTFSIWELTAEQQEAHFLNDLLLKYLKDKRFEDFAQEREELIYNWEMQNIVKPAAHLLQISTIMYNKDN
jgi:uncharacterized protein with ParB-like and HNH nuclease domain